MGWLDEGIEPGWVRAAAAVADRVEIRVMDYRKPVSYTHLTLPTTPYV